MESGDFKLFLDIGRSYRPRVTMRKNGQIGFSEAAVRRFGLDKFSWAQLLYSADRRAIAIQFHQNEPKEGGVKITKRKANFALAAKSLLDCYSIGYESGPRSSRTFDLRRLDELEDTFFFELGKGDTGEAS